MDLSLIKEKIADNKYMNLTWALTDFELMCENAITYNAPESEVHKAAVALHKFMRLSAAKMDSAVALTMNAAIADAKANPNKKRDSSNITINLPVPDKKKIKLSFPKPQGGTPEDDAHDDDQLQALKSRYELVASGDIKFYVPKTGKPVYRYLMLMLKEYRDEGGRTLADVFAKLPGKAEMPEYYKMIKEPIDIVKIEGRIIGNIYRDNNAFQTAVELMFANAREFNDPDSEIFVDATKLRDFFRRELFVDKLPPSNSLFCYLEDADGVRRPPF